MQAVRIDAHGQPDRLRRVEVAAPRPQPHEVLLRVRAAGVNYADVMMARGRYPGGPQPPYVPGFEAAGEVVEAGAAAPGFAPGQRVAAITSSGAYAELATAPAATVLPLPEGVSFEEGAAFPVAFLTAHLCLHGAAALHPGEWVLVHAAACGVGTAAVRPRVRRRAGRRAPPSAGAGAPRAYVKFEKRSRS